MVFVINSVKNHHQWDKNLQKIRRQQRQYCKKLNSEKLRIVVMVINFQSQPPSLQSGKTMTPLKMRGLGPVGTYYDFQKHSRKPHIF